MNVRMKRAILLSALLLATSGAVARAAPPEGFGLYDDFAATTVNKTKWRGGEGVDVLGLEATRAIENGQFRLTNRSAGGSSSNEGIGRNFVFQGVTNPGAVNEMKAKVTVTSLQAGGCATNLDDPTQANVGLYGSFFNTVISGPTPGSQEHDVVAIIAIFRASNSVAAAGVLNVGAAIVECLDATCASFAILNGADLGTITAGTPAKLVVRWDPDNDQFLFKRDADAAVPLGYEGTDSTAPGLPFKAMEALNTVANCTGVTKTAAVSALFDNFQVNLSAVP